MTSLILRIKRNLKQFLATRKGQINGEQNHKSRKHEEKNDNVEGPKKNFKYKAQETIEKRELSDVGY